MVEESKKTKEEWLKTITIGFGVAGIGVAFALILYFLFGKN